MFCYNCGCLLSEQDFCTGCGADVARYKKIIYASNRFYNEGLEKATLRDLSGAISSLRQSLRFNKNNIDARNLLGLVYFEMGEVVAAMSEWVISKNYRTEKNIADDYINLIESNSGRLDELNRSFMKYNNAYDFCVQGSKDLAVIQLKKVLSLNPKFIRAHQLLALLYMDDGQWDKAKREVKKCLEIDKNNLIATRYMGEIEKTVSFDDSAKSGIRPKKEEVVRYQSDNEIIIQPVNVKEQKGGGLSTLINIGIGIVIGLAAMYFWIVPAKIAQVNNDAQKQIAQFGEQLDSKNVNIQSLEAEVQRLKSDNENLRSEIEGYVGTDGTLSNINMLLSAASKYIEKQDAEETGKALENIAHNVDMEAASEDFKKLYDTLLNIVGPQLAVSYYNDGYAALRTEDYTTAITLLTKAYYFDSTNVDALFNLAMAYRGSSDNENASQTFKKVIELFPDSEKAARAQRYLETN